MTETEDGALVVPDKVMHQLDALRESGAVNMFTEIDSGLQQMGFEEAQEWLEENREDYIDHAMTGGFVAESEYDE